MITYGISIKTKERKEVEVKKHNIKKASTTKKSTTTNKKSE